MAIDTCPEIVMKMRFILLALGNASIGRWVIPLVTIPLLDFVMIR